MMKDRKSIVSFAKPPVIERVLGVQFEPLELTSGHLGKFWASLGEEWGTTVDAPRLSDQFETFGKRGHISLPEVRFEARLEAKASVPANRLRILTRRGDRMLQLQDTRFVFNWIRKDDDYPRFRPTLQDEFGRWFNAFRGFVAAANLGRISFNQWEVTYVNHIEAGELWTTPADWPNVIPGLLTRTRDVGGTCFEAMVGEWRSEIPKKQGRLHIQVQYRQRESEKALALVLTTRGPVDPDGDIIERLALGHDVIVRAFDEVTSPSAHRAWGKQNGD